MSIGPGLCCGCRSTVEGGRAVVPACVGVRGTWCYFVSSPALFGCVTSRYGLHGYSDLRQSHTPVSHGSAWACVGVVGVSSSLLEVSYQLGGSDRTYRLSSFVGRIVTPRRSYLSRGGLADRALVLHSLLSKSSPMIQLRLLTQERACLELIHRGAYGTP